MKKNVLSKFFSCLSEMFKSVQKLGQDTRERMSSHAVKSNKEE